LEPYLRASFARLLVNRYFPAAALGSVLMCIGVLTRVALWLHPGTTVPATPATLAHVFGLGALFDLATAAFFCAPLVLYLSLVPDRVARWSIQRLVFTGLFGCGIYLLCLVALAEWVFWDEFGTRFNFIAVDYLVYTREVLGNIWQSYPVGKLLAALLLPALGLTWLVRRGVLDAPVVPASWRMRLAGATASLLLPLAVSTMVSGSQKDLSGNVQENELAGNGSWEFFAAAYNSELDYERFYAVLPAGQASRAVERLLDAREGPGDLGLLHKVSAAGAESRFNVVLISVESLGSEFIGTLGNRQGLTPNLDALTGESLFFTNLYATGNRTVRGLEALSLSIPPTPGESIVKRPHNEGLFSIGGILADKGYDVAFVYGGYSYFDNMGYFFEHNGYRVVDRTSLAKSQIHHENIWGVADEDLYDLTLQQADQAGRQGRPFFLHVMTTSNHRPYTYPEGRVDIPSGSGREGAVKYTDYAIGEFLRKARGKPWFRNTIFVLTADHGASARGTEDIPVERYRIPLWIYAPGLVAAGRVDRLMSQIDIAPTLLGLLHARYDSKFFGADVFAPGPAPERAFLATYQTLGYIRDGMVVTLSPRRAVHIRPLDPGGPLPSPARERELEEEAIAFYQIASKEFRSGAYRLLARQRSAPT
jgi:phosphoglycerol transferase MdoB-like AlkP superfamily enzyme